MNKIKTLLKAPILTQSGYGVHSRQIFKSLFNDPLFDLHVESIRWGNTPFLTEETPEKTQIKKCIQKATIAHHEKKEDYDLFIHVTIPNEFEKKARCNIGITAGIETDRVSHVWIQKCNEMDLIIVPSEHSKKVFDTTIIDWKDEKGKSGEFKLDKPIIVCSEGVDTSVYKKLDKLHDNAVADLELEADFNFLHVGQWGSGGFGEDRKNIANLVRYFIETFKGRKDVGLVLKTNMSRNTLSDLDAVERRINQIKSGFKTEDIPPIYLIHGNLTHEEMVNLYNHPKIKSFISLTHGEGFGLPLLEAAACELPIIATNWSGHLDFLKKGTFSAIGYQMTEVPESAIWEPIIIKGSQWATVSEEDTKRRLRKMVSSYSKPKEWSKALSEDIFSSFDISVVCQEFVDSLKQFLLSGQSSSSKTKKLNPVESLREIVDAGNDFNILYTMPMSNGDVFISTAVIDGLMKDVPPNSKIYFATDSKYASILEGNSHIHKVINWQDWMLNIDVTEQVFDLVLTPNVATQYNFSNWVRRGQGRKLAEEFANHCNVELGDYWIRKDPVEGLPEKYITFHPGSGAGQWEARNYADWPEVIKNIKATYPKAKIVQVGSADEPTYDVDVDLRGKTTVQQLATVLHKSELHMSIDTFTMHMAAAFETPVLALFGCSYAMSTGPWVKDEEKSKLVLLESERRTCGCTKACYKNKPIANIDYGPINEIDPKTIVRGVTALMEEAGFEKEENEYERVVAKISGYTTTYNIKGYPFIESIRSMLGFCDEVVVVDGCSDDGTYEILEKLAESDDRIQLYQNTWDFDEPGMDGLQKAFARALCEHEFLWQQDCDEVVHESDYEKIKLITKRFPKSADILHLPIAELWGNGQTVTGRRHSWKWRMSRNKPEITHGIHKQAQLIHEKTSKVYAKKGFSDGCEYVNLMSNDMLPHIGFYMTNRNVEMARVTEPETYAELMNQVFDILPTVYHYSWCGLERKIRNFTEKWDKQWSALYQTEDVKRFPNVSSDEEIKALAQRLYDQGGEDEDELKYKFNLKKAGPAIMGDWLGTQNLNND